MPSPMFCILSNGYSINEDGNKFYWNDFSCFSTLTLLVGRQEAYLACKNEWWGAGMVICMERGADLHITRLMPLPLTIGGVA